MDEAQRNKRAECPRCYEDWHTFREILRDARELYRDEPMALDAIEYIAQRLERAA